MKIGNDATLTPNLNCSSKAKTSPGKLVAPPGGLTGKKTDHLIKHQRLSEQKYTIKALLPAFFSTSHRPVAFTCAMLETFPLIGYEGSHSKMTLASL